ncbi:unnamed protein product [Urochloa decumbens]|uniref:Protein kinase domain-containing protein n=1 Tax=Urochloa decumbens TaxID=240449 RepID=A0ABC9AN17_9POAL
MINELAMSAALEDLVETLDSALKKITYCQKKHYLSSIIVSGDVAEQLHRVHDDISNKMMLAMFATHVHSTVLIENLCLLFSTPTVSIEDDVTQVGNGSSFGKKETGSHSNNSTSVHKISGSSETDCIHSIVESKNILPSWSGAVDIYSSSTNTTEVHDLGDQKDDENAAKGKVNIEEYDVEKILDEQETHDLYCPNCKSCITQWVILKKRKRTARRDGPPKKPQLEEPCANVSNQAPDESHDQELPDVFGCLSCFPIFILTVDSEGPPHMSLPILLDDETPPAPSHRDGWDIQKATVHGDLVESFTSLSVIPVAAAAKTSLKKFSLSELEDATHNFLEDNIIGQGGFATVYKGVLHDGFVVAVKKIQYPYQLSMEHICDELTHVSKLEHKNIVQLLGYGHGVLERAERLQDNKVTGDKDDLYLFLVEEYMTNGSLDNIIYGSKFDWSSRFSLMHGIAHGLIYLHEQQYVHLDLKPDNVLIDSDMNPKITDFGRARMLDQGDDVTTRDTDYLLAGTMGYMPPEYIMEGIVSKMYDVYSFGVILLESISSMCGSESARHQASIKWAWAAREAGQMEELLDPLCSESQVNEARRCLEIGLLCTQSDGADRPTMLDVVEMLDSKRELPTPKQQEYTKGRSA